MNTDDSMEKMLMQLKVYIDQLSRTLVDIPEEIKKTKKQCEEIVDLAGELDDRLK